MGGGSSVPLTEEQIQKIQAETEFDRKQIQRLWKRFNLLDVNQNGFITRKDFAYLPELASNPLADRILESFQPSKRVLVPETGLYRETGEDEVDFVLFVRAMDAFNPQVKPRKKLELLYRMYDYDGDGLISRQDLTTAMNKMIGFGASKERMDAIVEEVFAAVDEDGNGTLNFDEFCQFINAEDLDARMTIKF